MTGDLRHVTWQLLTGSTGTPRQVPPAGRGLELHSYSTWNIFPRFFPGVSNRGACPGHLLLLSPLCPVGRLCSAQEVFSPRTSVICSAPAGQEEAFLKREGGQTLGQASWRGVP